MPVWHLTVAALFVLGFVASWIYDVSSPGVAGGWSMLLWFALWPLALVSLVTAAAQYRKHRWRAGIPLLIVLSSFVHAFWATDVGTWLRERSFAANVATFDALIAALPAEPWDGPRVLDLSAVEPNRRRCCTRVLAYRDSSRLQVLVLAERSAVAAYLDSTAVSDGSASSGASRGGSWSPERLFTTSR
jgi:hypothetical protein